MKLAAIIRGGFALTTTAALGGVLLAQEVDKQGYPLPGVKPSHPPHVDPAAKMLPETPTEEFRKQFRPGLSIEQTFSLDDQLETYRKAPVDTVRPMLNLGRPMYLEGPLRNYPNFMGRLNPTTPHFMVYGDARTAVGFSRDQNLDVARIATRLNLDLDFQITATERIHAFAQPFDKNGRVMSADFGGADGGDEDFVLDGNLNTIFFEGDLGPMTQGITGVRNEADLPFAVGKIPLLFQNGVWMEDAFVGAAFTIPARNSSKFDISNMDTTFFAGFDDVTSGAMRNADIPIRTEGGTRLLGATSFIEMLSGYAEVGYGLAFNGGDGVDADSHNLSAAWTRRYWDWLSNSIRVIFNFGENTESGVLLLAENSFRTRQPYTLLPYFNAFVGIGQPESLARDAGAGGVLKNTGINFEADALTLFPRLDDTGHDRVGAALGVEYLPNLFTAPHRQQIVVELAALHSYDDDAGDLGDQVGLGARYQIVVAPGWILRADVMGAFVEDGDEIAGVRLEIRKKW